ncbi:MAG: cyclic-di-AMP receptor [Oscillospiraceae bacterium]|nr:cyclic-di-AMP receptor [Oscillospiraceae bacterium]
MKLIMAVISSDDSNNLIKALTTAGYSVTKLSTTGGFLFSGNTTLIIGIEDAKVNEVLKIIEEKSKKRKKVVPTSASYGVGVYAAFPTDIEFGGATVFVLNVERFEKI